MLKSCDDAVLNELHRDSTLKARGGSWTFI